MNNSKAFLAFTLSGVLMLQQSTTASPVKDLDEAIKREQSKPKITVSLTVSKEPDIDDYSDFQVIQSEDYYRGNILTRLGNNPYNPELANCIEPILEVADSTEDAYFIAAVMILESDWGRSRICKDKNNYFSYRAYDRDAYGYAKSYDSFEEALADFKMLIQTYNVKYDLHTIEEIGSRYCTSSTWADKVKNLMSSLKDYDNRGGH